MTAFHDEIQQFLKLGLDIKVIPWTDRASSRSKIDPENMKKPPSKVALNRPQLVFMYRPKSPNGPETELSVPSKAP